MQQNRPQRVVMCGLWIGMIGKQRPSIGTTFSERNWRVQNCRFSSRFHSPRNPSTKTSLAILSPRENSADFTRSRTFRDFDSRKSQIETHVVGLRLPALYSASRLDSTMCLNLVFQKIGRTKLWSLGEIRCSRGGKTTWEVFCGGFLGECNCGENLHL